MRWYENFWFLVIVAGLFASVPILVVFVADVPSELWPYIAPSLSLFVTALAALAALAQYRRNSREKRIERSMEFWKRANSAEFTECLEPFLNCWIEGEKAGDIAECFSKVAKSNDERIKTKLSIEYLLDFYDEACSGVVTGACDEDAMYFYLGPIMQRHAARLRPFMQAWQEKHGRPEKWKCFLELTARWEKVTNRLPSSRKLNYGL